MEQETKEYLKKLVEATVVNNTTDNENDGSEGEYVTKVETDVIKRKFHRITDNSETDDDMQDKELETDKIHESMIPGDDVMYVEYVGEKEMTDKEMTLDGKNYRYVQAKYPSGKVDIGVYDESSDMVYGINWFQKNILDSQKEPEAIPEATTVGGMGGYSEFGYDAPAFFATTSKKKKKKLEENIKLPLIGEYLYTNEGDKVTTKMINEWLDDTKGGEKPLYNGGKLVQIKSKCLTFPYCSQGAVDAPLKLIGETKDEMDEDSWEYVNEIAKAAGTKPERIIKIIRETYLRNYE